MNLSLLEAQLIYCVDPRVIKIAVVVPYVKLTAWRMFVSLWRWAFQRNVPPAR
jgi:hypothetical protein